MLCLFGCLLFVACCCVVVCLLFVGCSLCAVCGLLCVYGWSCSSFVVRRRLIVVPCLLFVVGYFLFVVCSLLY